MSRGSLVAAFAALSTTALACQPAASGLDSDERRAIAARIEQRVKTAYDLGSDDVLAGLLSLYPRDGRVYSAAGGAVTTTSDSVEAAVRQFWN